MRSTAAPYTESRLARLVRNKRVGFPVVEQVLWLLFHHLAVFRYVAHLAIRANLLECLAVMEAPHVEIQISLKNFENE